MTLRILKFRVFDPKNSRDGRGTFETRRGAALYPVQNLIMNILARIDLTFLRLQSAAHAGLCFATNPSRYYEGDLRGSSQRTPTTVSAHHTVLSCSVYLQLKHVTTKHPRTHVTLRAAPIRSFPVRGDSGLGHTRRQSRNISFYSKKT